MDIFHPSESTQRRMTDLALNIGMELAKSESPAPLAGQFGSGDIVKALLFDHLDRFLPDRGFDKMVEKFIAGSIEQLRVTGPKPLPLGLHSGFAGLCYVVFICSRESTRYEKLVARLDKVFFQLLTNQMHVLRAEGPNPWSSFDIISGSSGILRYLLDRCDDPQFEHFAAIFLEDLVERTHYLESSRGYWVSSADLPTQRHRSLYPNGCVDCGMAHGLPGVLAIMSQYGLASFPINGLRDSVEIIARWILDRYSELGRNWPFAYEPGATSDDSLVGITWCYGSPGVPYALLQAGLFLDDQEIRDFAMAEIEYSVISYVRSLDGWVNPMLCHGGSGIFQIGLRSGSGMIASELLDLAEAILKTCEQANPLRSQDFGGVPYLGGGSFLEGAAGVSMAMACQPDLNHCHWDKFLMLA